MIRRFYSFCILSLALGFVSCSKEQPEACISIQQRVTTFYSNEEVQFQASCSKNAAAYQWMIGKPGEYQTFNTPTVQLKFEKTGTYEVKLRVGNDQQSDLISMIVEVVAPNTAK